MTRLKHRPDCFSYRGNGFGFHRFQDGNTLARLDPYAKGEQAWPLHSGRTIGVTAAEIRDITYQVHGIELPETDPRDTSDLVARIEKLETLFAGLGGVVAAPEPEQAAVDEPPLVATSDEAKPVDPPPDVTPAPAPREAELKALRERILELEDANAKLIDALADAEDRIADLDEDDDAHKFPAPDERLSDWDVVGATPAWLDGDEYAREGEDMNERIRRLTSEFRARVNLLNNFLLDASITPEQEAELADKQAKYHELAELGDRS